MEELYQLLNIDENDEPINNTVITNNLIYDLCENSSPEKGLHFSEKSLHLMNEIKKFNYKNIYGCPRIKPSNRFFNIVINEIYDLLKSTYDGPNTLNNLQALTKTYPKLCTTFICFMQNYYDFNNRDELKLKNKVLFSIDIPTDFYKSIISFISGMTDNFAIEIYNEIIHF